jgi:hypothetical protein
MDVQLPTVSRIYIQLEKGWSCRRWVLILDCDINTSVQRNNTLQKATSVQVHTQQVYPITTKVGPKEYVRLAHSLCKLVMSGQASQILRTKNHVQSFKKNIWVFVCETISRVQYAKKTLGKRADYGQFQDDRIITSSDLQLKDCVAMIGHYLIIYTSSFNKTSNQFGLKQEIQWRSPLVPHLQRVYNFRSSSGKSDSYETEKLGNASKAVC